MRFIGCNWTSFSLFSLCLCVLCKAGREECSYGIKLGTAWDSKLGEESCFNRQAGGTGKGEWIKLIASNFLPYHCLELKSLK